ncbi:MAG: magnesium transporter [Pseudomonadales bacterium]
METEVGNDTKRMDEDRLRQLTIAVERRAPLDAIALLDQEQDAVISEVLSRLEVAQALRVLACWSEERARQLAPPGASGVGQQWTQNLNFPEDSVGRLVEPVTTNLRPGMTVTEAIALLRPFAQPQQLAYAYVVDDNEHLLGAVTMRELLFTDPDEKIEAVMVIEPFYFSSTTPVEQAMRAVLRRHYPMYPVCDVNKRLLGIVRGYMLFEQQTYNLTAQAGRMVGIEKEEHMSTHWTTSLKMRHPWLQLNLLTAFVAGAVVGVFEDTIQQVVALAVFLPVLAGQSGNTGCQALAITLRSMTLNELKPGMERRLVAKEALLGILNGSLVGVTAGAAMLGYAILNGNAEPVLLAGVVLIAMLGSCAAAGMAGVMIPLVLRRFGADPATASTIFLTTATDVVSMGAMLALATIVLL